MVKWKKYLGIVLSAAMMATCVTGCGEKKTENQVVLSNIEQVEASELEDTINTEISSEHAEAADKEETVYVMADASGNVDHVIVSNWLKNPEHADTLNDYTELTDIENVKGYETYVANEDGTITWQADGADIYYQGTSEAALPVDVKITYKLDGEEISPEELAGKSGTVTIRFDYTNQTKTMVTIDGKKKEAISPFVMVSGVILPTDQFSNVVVENGRVISEGSNQIVIGYAVPGLKECLEAGITDDNLSDMIENMEIPEYVEITAEVEDFSLSMTMSAAVSGLLSSDTALDETIDLSELTDNMNTLGDSANQLAEGSGTLSNGLETLKQGTYSLRTGSEELAAGANSIETYTGQLAEGAAQLADAVVAFDDGINALKDGTASLNEGAGALAEGAAAVKDGVDTVYEGEAALKDGAALLVAGYEGDAQNAGAVQGASSLASGASAVSAGVTALVEALSGIPDSINAQITSVYSQLQAAGLSVSSKEEVATVMATLEADGIDEQELGTYRILCQAYYTITTLESVSSQLSSQLQNMSEEITQLTTGAAAVADGASSLNDGIAALYDGTKSLYSGIDTLMTGTGTLTEGATDVADGAALLDTKMDELYAGSLELVDGSGQLITATNTLDISAGAIYSGAITLSNGADSLAAGALTLDAGTEELNDGAKTLSEGMAQFNEEGIKKLVEAFSGDYESALEFVEALFGDETAYHTYSGVMDGKDCTVKFIYETEAIE